MKLQESAKTDIISTCLAYISLIIMHFYIFVLQKRPCVCVCVLVYEDARTIISGATQFRVVKLNSSILYHSSR